MNKEAIAKDGLERVAERIQKGALSLAPADVARRRVLSSGRATSQPNLTLSMLLRFVPGGRKMVIDLIQHAALNGDLSAGRWWTVWSDLRLSEQDRVDLNAICEVSSVPPKEFMAIAISTAMELGTDVADLTAAVLHPRVVKQTFKSAMRIGGEYADVAQRDREMVLQHGKFIAPPKGTTVTVNASAQAAAAAAAAQPSVPTFMESIRAAQTAHKAVQKQLERSVDGEVVE